MNSIELVTRHHLNVQSVQVLTPGMNICRLTMEDIIKSEPILSRWEAIAHTIPSHTVLNYRSMVGFAMDGHNYITIIFLHPTVSVSMSF